MGVDRVLERNQRSVREMAVNKASPVAHGNPIIHRNGVELFGNAPAASILYFVRRPVFAIAQMDVTRLRNWVNEFTTAIIGLPKSASGHSGGAPQRTSTRHITTMSGGGGTVLRHTLFTPSVCLVNGTVRAVQIFVFID
ncbi:hypothetical protein ACLB1R_27040 [Escherichia coli]